jgi:hypothetical protein
MLVPVLVRNYRQISQRRMTEEEERFGTPMLQEHPKEKQDNDVQEKKDESIPAVNVVLANEAKQQQLLVARQAEEGYSNTINILILPPRIKKQVGSKEKNKQVELDPLEIQPLQLMKKNIWRMLAQIEKRKEQKLKHTALHRIVFVKRMD